MARFNIHESSIFPYYEQLICFGKRERNKTENTEFNTALNLNIILSSACLVEGVLEDRGKLLLGYHHLIHRLIDVPTFQLRKPKNIFFNNVERMLHQKVSQSTGLDNFATLFETLTGKMFKQNEQIASVYEGINTLFQLRNVIAHGRLIHAYTVDAYYTDGPEENFFGGYKKAECYLIKKGLLTERFMEVERSDLYFTDAIADHFSDIAHEFIQSLDIFIFDNLMLKDIIQEDLEKFNQNSETTYSMAEYLRYYGTINVG